MPYPNVEAAKKAGFPTEAEGIALNISQINKLADIYDAVKKAGTADNPMAVSWTQWKELYVKKGNSWVKREGTAMKYFVKISSRAWSDVDKTKLPKSSFADQGDPEKKSTWRFPYKEADGTINRAGVISAWATMYGARTGKITPNMPQEAISRIKTARQLIGLDDDKKMREAYADATPGQGQGVGKPKQGAGGRDMCQCPECGQVEKHERGIPCVDQKCSKCGANMAPHVEKKEFEMGEIVDMAVFKTGTHNKNKFTDEALDEIANNFEKLNGKITPKLKITHRENQEKVAGLASYGDIYRVIAKAINGVKHILISVKNVPKEVMAWVKDRRFPERSIEIYPKLTVDGKEYSNVLRNVSLLGHEPPAVTGLAPIKATEDGNEYNEITVSFSDDDTFELHDKEGGEKDMEKKDVTAQFEALQEAIDKLKVDIEAKDSEIAKMKDEKQVDRLKEEKDILAKKLAETEKQVSDFKKLEADAKEGKVAKDELGKLKEKQRKDFIQTSIEDWKKAGQILPKDESVVKTLMESLNADVIKFKVPDGDSEKEVESSQLDLLKRFIDSHKVIDFKEVSGGGEGDKGTGEDKIEDKDGREVINDDLDGKAKKYMNDHDGTSYEEALMEVG